jgi:hypothetical protein
MAGLFLTLLAVAGMEIERDAARARPLQLPQIDMAYFSSSWA